MSSRRAIHGDATTWKMESNVFRDLPSNLDGLATARAGFWRTCLSTTRAEGYYSWAEAEWIAREWCRYPAPISPYSTLNPRRGVQRKIHSIYGASWSYPSRRTIDSTSRSA